MSNDKMREEFEVWWRREYENTLYCESAWRGWQASRAALSIELPESYPRHRDSVFDVMDAELVVEAIEAAGVRVKP